MKAILVVDIPEDYTGSVISVNLYGRNNKVIHEIHTNKLRPLPQEREFGKQNILPIKVDGNSFVLGWNACLKEITK